MYVRKLKRKCSVRGCKCTDTYAISLTREVGNTVIICKSCLGKALGAIDEVNPDTKSNIPVVENNPAPPLFFNAVALGLNKEAEPIINEESDGSDVTPPVTPPAEGDVTPPATPEQTDDETTPPTDNVVPDVPPASDEGAGTGEVTPPADPVTPPASPEDVTGDNPENTNNSTEPENPNPENKPFVCPHCGRGFDSDKGLIAHLRYCQKAQKSE